VCASERAAHRLERRLKLDGIDREQDLARFHLRAVSISLAAQVAAHPRSDLGVHVAVDLPDRLGHQLDIALHDRSDEHLRRGRRAGRLGLGLAGEQRKAVGGCPRGS
jgi:hypothetical protein